MNGRGRGGCSARFTGGVHFGEMDFGVIQVNQTDQSKWRHFLAVVWERSE